MTNFESHYNLLTKNPAFLETVHLPWSTEGLSDFEKYFERLYWYMHVEMNNLKPRDYWIRERYYMLRKFERFLKEENITELSEKAFHTVKFKISDSLLLILFYKACLFNEIITGNADEEFLKNYAYFFYVNNASSHNSPKAQTLLNIDHFYQLLCFEDSISKYGWRILRLYGASKFEALTMRNSLTFNNITQISISQANVISECFNIIPNKLNKPSDFTMSYMLEHVHAVVNHFYKSNPNSRYPRLLANYYKYMLLTFTDYLEESLQRFDANSLDTSSAIDCLADQYEIVQYDPFQNHPVGDKWKVCFSYNQAKRHSCNTLEIRFDNIQDAILKKCLKTFIWHDINERIMTLKYYIDFCKCFSAIEKKQIVNDFSKITVDDCYRIHNYVKNNYNIHTAKKHLRSIYLTFIGAPNGLLEFTPSGESYLRISDSRSRERKVQENRYEPLKKVLDYLKSKGTESDLSTYYFLSVMMLTGFRAATVVRLTVNDLIEKTKVNNYKEYTCSIYGKTNVNQKEIVPISNKAATMIKQAIKLSDQYRNECSNPVIKELIFIDKQRTYNCYTSISVQTILTRTKVAAKEVGVNVTPTNFRDYYLSEAIKLADVDVFNTTNLKTITMHSSLDTLRINYDTSYDINAIFEAMYEAEVNHHLVKGKIVEKTQKNNTQKTECGLGYCQKQHCGTSVYHPCLLCENFITSPDEIENYKDIICYIDKALETEQDSHERDFLHRKKEICVSYLVRLTELKNKKEKIRR